MSYTDTASQSLLSNDKAVTLLGAMLATAEGRYLLAQLLKVAGAFPGFRVDTFNADPATTNYAQGYMGYGIMLEQTLCAVSPQQFATMIEENINE